MIVCIFTTEIYQSHWILFCQHLQLVAFVKVATQLQPVLFYVLYGVKSFKGLVTEKVTIFLLVSDLRLSQRRDYCKYYLHGIVCILCK